jgi:pyridoxine 4-dehydrogenase
MNTTFKIGGDLEVRRLGFGAMRIVGKGVWGPPPDVAEAKRVLRRVPELGIDFVDTADSYGPDVSEELIGETISSQVVVATTAGLARTGPDQWVPLGRPEYLRQQLHMSLRRLRRDRIDLWQLHRIDPNVPREEQFDCIAQFQKEGLVRHLGLSEVKVEEIEAASKHFQVATVQNRFNLTDRSSEDVLEHCEKNGIGFIPWFPLGRGKLSEPGGELDQVASQLKATPSQVAIAWLLERSPVILPIPGTGSVAHLEENAAAARLALTKAQFYTLN